ncbi:MAG: indolepyruvate oxidoreductase subunit beta [Firmicutes bacterium]|nr:indolepyruvate oxidoreductase subunit beta [Bacillota bacterium]
MSKSIKVVGVGGQGTILLAKILTTVLVEAGYDVKMSEIHGMSQRGGSVSSEIRFGDKVSSPVIEKGDASILVSLEQMEAARHIDYLKKDGILIVNNYKIHSMVTLNGKVKYPDNIIEELSKQVETYVVDGTRQAIELGLDKVMNIIILGALAKALNIDNLKWEEAIKENVKPKFLELNLEAFKLGLGQVK